MRRNITFFVLLAPASAVIAVLLAAVAAVLMMSVTDTGGRLTLAAYQRILTDDFYVSIIMRSIGIAVYSTLVCVVLGFPMALVMARGPRGVATWVTLALAVQFFSIYVVKMYGWMLILGNNGIVNRLLMSTGLTSSPVRLMYNEFGVAVGLVGAALPLTVFPIHAVLRSINPRYEEAALGLGAGRLRTLAVVTIPLCIPGILSGMILTFVFCFTAYLTPALLGGGYFKMIGNLIYEQATGRFNYPTAAALATIALLISLAVIVGVNRVIRTKAEVWK